MYPTEPTYTEYINKLIEDNKPVEKDIIKEYIDKQDNRLANLGERYYFKNNDIVNRKIKKYTNDGQEVDDEDATNNKLASGWHKLLVDQKVGYLVGDPVTISYKEDKKIDPILELLGEYFDDDLTELVKNASNKGKDWMHVYIDKQGSFDYMIVPTQEFIPIYDRSKHKRLIAGIRYYKLDHDDIVKVEYHTEKDTTFYEIINGVITLDASEDINPLPHFYYGSEANGRQGYGWEKVPFIEFKNNEEGLPDILFYKDTIDVYDKIMSDSSNTLEDIQEFLYVIRGYEGEDISQAVTNFKRYKGVSVDAEKGGVDIVQGEMPMQSVGSFLDRLRETIYQEGQGVDTNSDKFGNSPSGIALKFLFSLLDMKANVLERKFTRALKEFMWFVCEYARIKGIGDYDHKKFTFTFNKSMLMNEQEQVAMAQQSLGVISKDTIMSNHPWVTDIEEEKRKLEEEKDPNEVNLDDPVNEETEENE